MDHKGLLDQVAQLANKELMVQLAHLVQLVRLVQKVKQGHKEQKASVVRLDH